MSRRMLQYAVLGSAVAIVAGVLSAQASTGTVTVTAGIVNDTFTNSAPDADGAWRTLDTPGSVVNHACLTHEVAAAAVATPAVVGGDIPNPCDPDSTPPGGLDSLQLTDNSTHARGGIQYTHAVPTTSAIDVTFKSYQLDGQSGTDKADGNAFFFAATNPVNEGADALTIGGDGGSLGYAGPSVGGLEHAYLGVGLDAFGNFSSSGANGTGCSGGGSQSAQTVTVRGPGNGTAGYCQVAKTTATGGGTLNYENGVVSPVDEFVPVEVVINPTANTVTAQGGGGESVDPGKFLVKFTPLDGVPQTVTGNLPAMSTTYVPDASWLNGAGVPKFLTFGWTAATGAGTDFHNITDVNAVGLTATPPPAPALSLNLTDNSGGTMQNSDTVTYTASASVSNADETQPIEITDTLPTGLTPQTASGTNWDCTASSGQTVDCTYTGGTISSGGSAPDLSIPVSVNFPSGTSTHNVDNQASVASSDASPSSAQSNTDTIQWIAPPSATVLQFINQPLDTDVSAPMVNPDNSQRHVTVGGYITSGGSLDTNYTGTVTLSITNPGGAQFVVGGNPTSSMTAQAVNGVADFSPIIINKSGLNYTLTATDTPDGLTQATSNSFNVGSATGCPAGQTCQTTTTSTGGDNALVQGKTGSTNTIIFAVYGGNVAPLFGCSSTPAPGILTISGDRQKIITLKIPANVVKQKAIRKFCWGQPTEWYGIVNGKVDEIHHFNPANQDLEGQLAMCSALPKKHKGGPCIQSINWKSGKPETVVIQSGSGDPHLAR